MSYWYSCWMSGSFDVGQSHHHPRTDRHRYRRLIPSYDQAHEAPTVSLHLPPEEQPHAFDYPLLLFVGVEHGVEMDDAVVERCYRWHCYHSPVGDNYHAKKASDCVDPRHWVPRHWAPRH